METNTEKWTKAIVNLESRYYSKEMVDLNDNFRLGLISQEDYINLLSELANSPNGWGTAIFLTYNNKYYLLTARHVVEPDQKKVAEEEDLISDKLLIVENKSRSNGTTKNELYYNLEMLMNLGSGIPSMRPYLYSSRKEDLAIICLSTLTTNNLIHTLLKKGYKPISVNDIDQECRLEKGQEIISFGFPGDLFFAGYRNLDPLMKTFHSDITSLPVVSRGVVVETKENENYFSGGIFVTHGNSGGPIVSGNKLVGIVSAQVWTEEIVNPSLPDKYIYRDLQFIKSSRLLPMIQDLEKRVNWVDAERKEFFDKVKETERKIKP